MWLTGKNVMFSDFTWKKIILLQEMVVVEVVVELGGGGGGRVVCPLNLQNF